jgi:hypothetical protein
MNLNISLDSESRNVVRDQSGQVLPWAGFLMLLFCGVSALVIDVGRGVIAYQQLVASTNASAMAAGYSLPNTNYSCEALLFSASSNSNTSASNYCGTGSSGVYTGANGSVLLQNVQTTVTPHCSSTIAGTGWNIPCQAIGSSTTTANVVTVHQTATIPTIFAGLMGIPSLSLGATASAAARGAGAESWNVAIIIDTTRSMTMNQDSNCGTVPGVSGTPTRLQCALYGVQVLLGNLDPCPQSYSSCSSTSVTSERVSLWTFPQAVASSVENDTNCSGSNPTVEPYTFPSSTPSSTNYANGSEVVGGTTYTVTYAVTTTTTGGTTPSYVTNYRTSDTASSLSTSAGIVDAVNGGGSSCSSIQAPGGAGTYYAGALYAAQASLLAEQAAEKSSSSIASQNAIIILSDGDATSSSGDMVTTSAQANGGLYASNSGSYPSYVDECGQAVTAAQTIAGQGTRIYSVAYGSESSGCTTDTSGTYSGISPCQTMEDIASSHWASPSTDQYFYADANQSGSGIDTSCASEANSLSNLSDIFLAIANDLQNSRLIPNSLAN